MKTERLQIKSAGFINGEYKVILSNDMELEMVQSIEIEKNVDSIGQIIIRLALENLNKTKINKT